MKVFNKKDGQQYELSITKGSGKQKIVCPACLDSRSNKSDKALSWDVKQEVGKCHYCESIFYVKKENTKMKIDFKEKKLPESKIHLSPTILIKIKDIEKILNKNLKSKTSLCSDCCQLVGNSVNCRTFRYKDKNYDYIPKEMIMKAINIILKNR